MSTTICSPMTELPRQKHSAYCVAPPSNFKPLRNRPSSSSSSTVKLFSALPSSQSVTYLPLHSVLPRSFKHMYTPDVLEDQSMLTPEGRPLFTKRELIDWKKNDVRSLLIVPSLKPEWHGKVPQIIEPNHNVLVLPLDASDEQIIDTLVSSDIYKEHNFEHRFLVQTAHYTVQAARQRHAGAASQSSSKQTLTTPEWRNIIENYLLNLACEAQCRLDFKKSCSYLKKHKLYQREQEERKLKKQQQQQFEQQQLPAHHHHHHQPSKTKSTSPLLKQAILTSLSTSPDFPSAFLPSSSATGTTEHSRSKSSSNKLVSLSRAEKQQIWVHVQNDLYARLGLNWEADELI